MPALPTPGSDNNIWGTELNNFLLVSLNADGTWKAVPTGGTTGEVLVKLSNADYDDGWVTPALPSNSIPNAPSGSGSPGVSTTYMRSDAYPPAVGSASVLDALPLVFKSSPASGDKSATPYSAATTSLFSDGRGSGMPFRVNVSATLKFGVHVTGAGSTGSKIRIGIFNDDAGGGVAGTLLADLGQVASDATGLPFTTASVALSSATRYWCVMCCQGGVASQPTVAQSPIIMAIPGMDNSGLFPTASVRYTITGAMASNPTVTSNDTSPPIMIYAQVA